MYGDKSQPEKKYFTSKKNGKKYLRTNLEYYITEEQFYQLREQQKSLKEICDIIGFPYNIRQFSRLINQIGWEVGDKIYGKYKMYEYNSNFFKDWTKDSAWVFGWLLTDGYITDNGWQIKLLVKKDDRELLEKIRRKIHYTGFIYDGERNGGRKYSYLRICSREMVEDLFSLGIPKENKTFNVSFPEIPDKFFWCFIRGVFEGDGHIRHKTEKGDVLSIGITGASERFMSDLKDALEKRGVFMSLTVKMPNDKTRSKNPLYVLNTKSNEDALRLCYFMYINTDDDCRLSRKFEIYKSYVRTYYDKCNRKSKPCIELVELARKNIPECNPDFYEITSTKPFLKLKETA